MTPDQNQRNVRSIWINKQQAKKNGGTAYYPAALSIGTYRFSVISGFPLQVVCYDQRAANMLSTSEISAP